MRWLLSIVFCFAVVMPNAGAATPERSREGGPRIRPQDPRSLQLLRAGTARSETFRALVDRIEASNVFVYVTVTPFIKSSLAGQLTWMTQAGPYRYLRATLNAEQTANQQIASLAHELQHAVEVVEESRVKDEKTLVALYQRIGQPSRAAVSSGWETIAAQEAGYRVRRELGDSTGAATAARMFDSGQL